MTIGTGLIAWNLLENGGDSKVLVVSTPMLMSLILLGLSFVALVWKNDIIVEAIECIQKHIGHRKLFEIIS